MGEFEIDRTMVNPKKNNELVEDEDPHKTEDDAEESQSHVRSGARTEQNEEADNMVTMHFHFPPRFCKTSVKVSPAWTITQLLQHLRSISVAPDVAPELTCLVYKGREMSPSSPLESYGPLEGGNVYAARNNLRQPASSTAPTAAAAEPSAMSQTNMDPARNPMARRPNEFASLLENPVMQSIMDNPDFMRMVMEFNPQIQQLREQVPELNHILNDPQLIRQTMEMVRNPNLLREVMRNNDRAMSNIDAIPGGFNALKKMYHTIQEPMWEATVEGNANLANGGQASQNLEQEYRIDTESPPNTQPLPNPWATPPVQSSGPMDGLGGIDPRAMSSMLGRTLPTNTNVVNNRSPGGRWPEAPQGPLICNRQTHPRPMPTQSATSNAARTERNTVVTPPVSTNPASSQADPAASTKPDAEGAAQGLNPEASQPAALTSALQSISLQTPDQAGPSQSVERPRSEEAQPPACESSEPRPSVSPPEQHFSAQLTELRDMGFENTDACVVALQACDGNVTRALDILLGNQ